MRQRNEQDFEERRQRIMDAALQVFAGKGFEQATNKDIATAAGIRSPGLIYHYFKDKSDLFQQVVEHRVPLLRLLSHPDEIMALPPHEALTRIGHAYLRILDSHEAIALLKLVIGEAARQPQVAQLFNTIGPNRIFPFVGSYLERQMEAGTLRRTDPIIAARGFFSPFVVFVLTRAVFQQPDALQLDVETFLTTTIENFLRGMHSEG